MFFVDFAFFFMLLQVHSVHFFLAHRAFNQSFEAGVCFMLLKIFCFKFGATFQVAKDNTLRAFRAEMVLKLTSSHSFSINNYASTVRTIDFSLRAIFGFMHFDISCLDMFSAHAARDGTA